MKSVRRICAVLCGIVLLVAGLLKLMDPLGASLVVGEYYNYLHLGFLAPSSKVVALAMALLEAITGAALITGVRPRLTALVSGVLLGAFTILTLVLWIDNPKMDCGCFGEALHLTHFQSFIKNVVLCVLWALAFLPLRRVWTPFKVKTVSFSIAVISIIAFMVYSLLNIPAMDFTPFKPGATLMQAQDSPSPDSPLLSICDANGDYFDELLADGHKLLLTAYDPDELSDKDQEKLLSYADSLADLRGLQTMFIAAGGFPGAAGAYTADRRSLMTVNRSNGGATLLSDGMVIAKWHLRSLPDQAKLASLCEQDGASAVAKENTPRRLKLQGFLLYLFAVILLL
ncbi:MAG: hypothetical protein J6O51_01260 [Bacteroidales bacterium]|nr:hypothetical protein [Bacteroidales bacterium]